MADTKAVHSENEKNDPAQDPKRGASGGDAPEGYGALGTAGGSIDGGYGLGNKIHDEGVATRSAEEEAELHKKAKEFMDSKKKADKMPVEEVVKKEQEAHDKKAEVKPVSGVEADKKAAQAEAEKKAVADAEKKAVADKPEHTK